MLDDLNNTELYALANALCRIAEVPDCKASIGDIRKMISDIQKDKTCGSMAVHGLIGKDVCVDVPDLDFTCRGTLKWHDNLDDTVIVRWETGHFSFDRKFIRSKRIEKGTAILELNTPTY